MADTILPANRATDSGAYASGPLRLAVRLLPIAFAAAACTADTPPAGGDVGDSRIPIERAEDLPQHTYAVESAIDVIEDDAKYDALATRLEADLNADLAAYDIRDRATLKSYWGTLGQIALKRSDYAAALAWQDSIRAIEDKPALKLMAGIVQRPLVASRADQPDRTPRDFRTGFESEVAALPWDVVQAELRSMKGLYEIMTPNVMLGALQTEVDPAARSGEVSRELAQAIVSARVFIDVIAPIREDVVDVLASVIAAHATEKPDIWAARDVSLDGRSGLTDVVTAIWDSGVDPAVYAGRLYTNAGEVAGNGRDDDGNGFVDDVHGTAFDMESNRTTGALFPLSLASGTEAEFRGYYKGFMDLQAGLDSREAQAVRAKLAATPPDQFEGLLEDLGQYSNYAHGSHVAGIAVRGNPAARVLIARITYDHRIPPQLPTEDLSRKGAAEAEATIGYFRRHAVRVVNMSWAASPTLIEAALEANNAGGAPDERRTLARRLFDIWAEALRAAIEAAPDILFVAAAGNEDADNQFGEWVPASFDLPNVITVGAVDRAGDEAAFTSYGKVEVWANGYEVPSQVPGGETLKLSGTSMAAPQVANLAAKLLAVRPGLSVAQLRDAIIGGADEVTIGTGRQIRLLNPSRSLGLVEASK